LQDSSSVFNDNGTNALRLEYSGSPALNEIGPMLTFAQRWYSSSTDNIRTGGIAGIKTIGDGAFGGGLAFYSQPNSGNNMNKVMVINHAGNVGIGTTNPAAKLDITGTNTAIAFTFGNTVPNNPLHTNYYGGYSGIGMDQTTAGVRIAGNSGATDTCLDIGYYTSGVVSHANWNSSVMVKNDSKVGIGTTSPAKSLHIKTPSATPATLRLDTGGAGSDVWDVYSSTAGRLYINAPAYGAGVYIQHSATSWTANSDETLKENITSLGTVGDKLKNYRTSYFNWINDQRETPKRQIGFIAQDWETDFPEVVNKVEGEPLGMQYTETIPILLKYIQELEARITTLENA
jgi:hypothetical protein